MKKIKNSALAALSVLSTLVAACQVESLESTGPSSGNSLTSKMTLRFIENPDTRSSVFPDEECIEEISVMVYNQKDGKLTVLKETETINDIGIELAPGIYDIYVTANMSWFEAPIEESAINEAIYELEDIFTIRDVLPMCWKGKVEIKTGENTTVYANLSRLVSKVVLNVEMGVLDGLDITSVRLCQGAGVLRPFMEGGSRILYPEECIDGDYASKADLSSLMNGESIHFYVTENCQGQLLPDNDDPWAKVPDSIGDKAGLCTYVEMTGVWNESADYEGKVTYRFYLGEDASKSFDIRRNNTHNLTLYLDEDSFDKISWKIDVSEMEEVAWEAYSSLEDNFHDQDNFYVTENICIEFSFDSNGQKYWAKRNNSFSLAGIDSDGNTIIRFEDPESLGKGKYKAMGTCIAEGDYEIVILNSQTGKTTYILEEGVVKTPGIIAGEDDEYADNPVIGFLEKSRMEINGDPTDICLYLIDDEGYNLNQGHYYGCDFSICDWDIEILNTLYGHDLFCDHAAEVIPGDSCSDSYAVCYRLTFVNDGKDPTWNKQLTESVGRDILQFNYTENLSGTSGTHTVDLECQNIDILFKPTPDSYKSVLGTEFMYVISNPSNIPLTIRGLKLNSMSQIPDRSKASTILCKDISGLTNTDPLLISKMPYSICSLEEDASPSVTIDGLRCYPAYDDGIGQSDIPWQKAMFHTFDVNYLYSEDGWMGGISGELDLYDTSEHASMYGDGWYGNCGAVMYTNNYSINLYDSYNGTVTDFSGYGDILSQTYIDKFNDTVEVMLGINEDNGLTAVASESVTVNLSISGTLTGHIRCVSVQDPFNSLWGYYFTYDQEFSYSQTLVIGTEPVAIDGGTIADAFADLRSQEYYSVIDVSKPEDFRNPPWTQRTVREYLKPKSMKMVVKMATPNDRPIAINFSGTLNYDYHTSDPVSWPGTEDGELIVPSSYSGYDSGLDDNGCPPGSVFVAETVSLQPNVIFNKNQDLYFIPQL